MKREFWQAKWSVSNNGAYSKARFFVVTAFGVAGACVLGYFAAPLLFLLSSTVAHVLNRPAAATTYPLILKVIPFAVLGAIFGGFIGTLLVNFFEKTGSKWDRMDRGNKVNVYIAVVAGLVLSVNVLNLFQGIDLLPGAKIGLFLVLVAGLGALIMYMLQSMNDYLPWAKSRGKARRSGIKIMDTNIIIDGRIYDIAKTGFLDGQLYVPGFVLDELQYIADSHDQLRRQRGRRGLEVLKHMQADFHLDVRIHDKLAPEMQDDVDARLVRLAKALGGDILTNDFNLKRVAELQDVRVLSLNDLSLALRPNVLPQETLGGLKIIREGNQFGQGVGYLEDGTMVVVENGQGFIGETRDVIVTQVIQTERGKMIFAEVEGDVAAEARANSRRRRT
jgi:uncharacterized protein YacL